MEKDLHQADILLDVLCDTRKHDLRDTWEELVARGPKWRQLATRGLERISAEVREKLENAGIVPSPLARKG